jgi:hypothetical protein
LWKTEPIKCDLTLLSNGNWLSVSISLCSDSLETASKTSAASSLSVVLGNSKSLQEVIASVHVIEVGLDERSPVLGRVIVGNLDDSVVSNKLVEFLGK